MTCLPKAFPVFSPFSFMSRCLYSAYVLLIISLLALSTLLCVHLCPNLPLSKTLILLVFYDAQYLASKACKTPLKFLTVKLL